MKRKLSLSCVVVSCLIVSMAIIPAYGQVATLLVLEGDQLPGAPGETVASINNSAVNHAGGYAFTINSSDSVATISHVWGNPAGGAGAVMWTEGTYGIYTQSSFESFFGINDAGLSSYSAISTNNETGSSGLDGVWLDDLVVAIEEEPYPHDPGFWWSFGSRPGTTADGIPHWVGGITDTQGGATDNRGLFYSTAATPLLLGGDFVVGLPDPLHTASTVSFDYRFSELGSHYIAEVRTDTGLSTNDNHLVSDGSVLMVAGQPISEGSPIPPEANGVPGENWDNFDYTGITESGMYMFTGDTDGNTANDEFVAIDGIITYREGMTLDGFVVSGSIEGAFLNEDGDVAFIWDIDTVEGNVEALYIEDILLLKEGDPVDIDGDMIPDDGAVVDAFTGISSLTMSDRMGGVVNIYFTADINITGMVAKRGILARGSASDVPTVGEEAGLSASDLAELVRHAADSDRVVLEGGFVISVPTVVPVFLSSFDVQPVPGAVTIAWAVHTDGDPGEFRLVARQGGTTWEVPFQVGGNGSYAARDEQVQGGSATYTLFHLPAGQDWTQLGSQTVNVEMPDPETRLLGAHPNPFNPHTDIAFSLDRAQHVRIALYDMSGHLVRLLAEELFAGGTHAVPWDGKDASGRTVSSGSYLVRMETTGQLETQKIMLVR